MAHEGPRRRRISRIRRRFYFGASGGKDVT
jgi:hypothetical protein